MTAHSIIFVAPTATRITPPGVHSGMDITIQNLDPTAYAYIGGEGVDSENFGYRLSPGSAISWELPGTDELYVYAESPGLSIAVIKTNLGANR